MLEWESTYLPVLQGLATENLDVQRVLISLGGQQFDQPRLQRLDWRGSENQRRHPPPDGTEKSLACLEIAPLDSKSSVHTFKVQQQYAGCSGCHYAR